MVDDNSEKLIDYQSNIERLSKAESKLAAVQEQNQYLVKENDVLKARVLHLEKAHLKNNMLITGIPEQPWEQCLQSIAEAISWTIDGSEDQAN